MKFTNGYWLTREEIEPIYAVEYGYHRIENNTLTVYAASVHVEHRGDCVNVPMLTISFSSPMENIIKVSVQHFRGRILKGRFLRRMKRMQI